MIDGEIAVPSGLILQRGTDLQWSKNKPAGKASIWRDVDGDGDKHHGPAFGVVTEKGQGEGGEGSVGTFGRGGCFDTQYFADPKEQLIGVLMKQTQGDDDNTGWKFRPLVGQTVDD